MSIKSRNMHLKISITVILIGILVLNTNFESLYKSLKLVSIGTLIMCIVLSQIGILSNAFKWKIILPKYRVLKLYSLNLIGQYYSTVLPGQLVGAGIKAYMLGKEDGKIEEVAATVVIDKLTGLIGIFVVSTVGVLFSQDILEEMWTYIFIGINFLMFISIILIRNSHIYQLVIRIAKKIEVKSSKFGKISEILVKLIESWRTISMDIPKVLRSILLGVFYQLIVVTTIYIFSIEINAQINYIDLCWILSMVSFAMYLPITVAGIGVREGTMVGLLGTMGVNNDKALSLSLLLLVIQLCTAGLGAIANILWKNNLNIDTEDRESRMLNEL